MESAMRIGCLGLLVLLMAGAWGADVYAQSAAPAPSGDGLVMPRAEDSGAATQTPSEQQGTADGSTGQAQQQPQQQQANDPKVQREAELTALRREHYGPREGMWFGAGPLLWWIKQAPAPGPLISTGG